MNTLKEKAMIVSLTISTWSGKVQDKKATREVEQAHNAHKAGKFVKNLVNEDDIKVVSKAGNAIRQYHYENTLPWDDSGRRLLPASNYFEYMTKVKALQSDFDKEVQTLVSNYASLVEDARRNLNGLFNPADYPTADELTWKHGVKLSIQPIEDAADFRVQINEQEAQQIRENIEQTINDNLATAQKDMFERLKGALVAMLDRLSDKDAIFRDSLVYNVKDLIDLIPRLNVTGNAEISAICDEMRALIVHPDTLRNSQRLRAETASKAADILGKYSFAQFAQVA